MPLTPQFLIDRAAFYDEVSRDAWIEEMPDYTIRAVAADAASDCRDASNRIAQLEAELAQVRAQQGAVRLDVSEIRQGEENDGPLMSTDLFIDGRGLTLLCNVSAGESFTFYAKLDGKELGGGTVGATRTREALATGTPPAPASHVFIGERCVNCDLPMFLSGGMVNRGRCVPKAPAPRGE